MTQLDSYLELGIIGMSRGGQLSWFNGHFGAALLAGYYVNHEHDLPHHVQHGIKRIGDHFRLSHRDWFTPIDYEEADSRLIERVVSGLRANTERLRTSGHGLALGVLALKALRDRPDLITQTVVDGLVKMLDRTTQDGPSRYWGIADYFELANQEVTAIPTYETTQDMVKQAFEELDTVLPDYVVDGKKFFFVGEKLHGLTHAHALSELERIGYHDLAINGMYNHRVQMQLNRQRPEHLLPKEVKEPIVSSIFAPEYWDKTYDDPHALKLPYAALDLLQRLPERERARAEFNTCKLLSTIQ